MKTARLLESQGQPAQNQSKETTRRSIEEFFHLSEPDTVEVRGKGPMQTSRVLGRNHGLALAGLRIPA